MKSGRRRDPIWEHAEQKDGRFICKYCRVEFAGGATRIKIHLSVKTGDGISRCPSAPPLDNQAPPRAFTSLSSPERPSNINSIPLLVSDSSSAGEVSQNEADDQLAKLLILSDIPLETVAKPHFQSLVSSIARLGPTYIPPSHSSILASVRNLQSKVEGYIKDVRKSWSTSGCTIKLHLKERKHTTYFDHTDVIGYTVYCREGVIFLSSQIDPSGPFSGSASFQQLLRETEEAMKQEATLLLHDVERGKDSPGNSISRDSPECSILFASCEKYKERCSLKCTTVVCPTTEIMLFLRDISQKCDWISDLLMEVKQVYGYLSRTNPESSTSSKFDHPFSELLVVFRGEKELKSTFSDESHNSNNATISLTVNQEKFWNDVEEVLDLVEPLIHILHVFDSFVPSIGYFFDAFEVAKSRFDECYRCHPEKFELLRISFRRLKGLIIKPVHLAAAYLDPSNAFYEFVDPEDKVVIEEIIPFLKDELVKSEEKHIFAAELTKYQYWDPSIFRDTARAKLDKYHPVKWWEEFGHPVRTLRQYAIRLLSQPSNCLSHLCHKHKLEGSDLLKLNLTMMEEFQLLGEKTQERIDVWRPL